MQAIQTKYHGPSDNKGARMSATCGRVRIYLGYDHALNDAQNHCAAARRMVADLKWEHFGPWLAGDLGENTFVFVASKGSTNL